VEQPLERNALLLEELQRAFAAIHDRQDQDDVRAGGSRGCDRLHGGAAGGCDIFEDHDVLAGEIIDGFDEPLGAVILHGLAHEKARDRPRRGSAQHRHRGDDRDGAELKPADVIDRQILDPVEHQLRKQARAFRIEHRRLEIEVELAFLSGSEHELAAFERQLQELPKGLDARVKLGRRRAVRGHSCSIRQMSAAHA
jgi:hypothetical protein